MSPAVAERIVGTHLEQDIYNAAKRYDLFSGEVGYVELLKTGYLLIQAARLDDAERVFELVLDEYPEEFFGYYYHLTVCLQMKALEKARFTLEKALSLYPQSRSLQRFKTELEQLEAASK